MKQRRKVMKKKESNAMVAKATSEGDEKLLAELRAQLERAGDETTRSVLIRHIAREEGKLRDR